MSRRMHNLTFPALAINACGRRVGFALGVETSALLQPAVAGAAATP